MLERRVREGLAPYAFHDSLSQGRRHKEPPHPYRGEFQRDRDRVIHTKAFRRLENKTQVFAPDYSDHFRNRLTHTLEVSMIARTIGQALGLNCDLCEALALSHDIGHPPFSHEGETVLDEIMRQHGAGFDHNLHALTIVEEFEERYPSFTGLNLTFEVREGIVKHSRDYQPQEPSSVDIRSYRLGERPPLEAQLIDLADEAAYNAADLDDGLDSGLIRIGQIEEEVSLFRQLYEEARRQWPGSSQKLLVRQTIRGLIDRLVTSLIRTTRRNLKEHRVSDVEAVRALPRMVRLDEETELLNQEIKGFLRRNLYEHSVLLEARRQARQLLQRLFRLYLDEPSRLPPDHYEKLAESTPVRVICNYIAGMTDIYAQAVHEELALESKI